LQQLLKILYILLAVGHTSVAAAGVLPRPDHVVVVIEENRSFMQIMDQRNQDSYIHALAKRGMLFTRSYGVSHPSQPNYLALFSGSTQAIINNACPFAFNSDNLASALLDGGLGFASFSESMPEVGDMNCVSGAYRRKHNPVTNWQGTRLPASVNRRFADFPMDYAKLPTVSFVIPDQNNDMHDGSFADADNWLKMHIAPYVDWAMKHNSLLILTWDEDHYQSNNRIATILVGPMVQAGTSDQRINHYNVLRTLLDFYGLPPIGESSDADPIKGIWLEH
jgi:phosphatidylinositol-3-phosphatase